MARPHATLRRAGNEIHQQLIPQQSDSTIEKTHVDLLATPRALARNHGEQNSLHAFMPVTMSEIEAPTFAGG